MSAGQAAAVVAVCSALIPSHDRKGVVQPGAADWQRHLAILSHAVIEGDSVTVLNVRNFRYGPTEADMHPSYYDRTYDLNTLRRVWFVTEPFRNHEYAAHTFLSFEFDGGQFLSVTIEPRKTTSQQFSVFQGLLHSYPLVYIAADERDVLLLRANIRKNNVCVFPVKTSRENARRLLRDMLQRMDQIAEHPVWYNTLWANCTSEIAYHVNHISPGRVPAMSWKLRLTGYADALALEAGLLDTTLPLQEARRRYRVTERSQQAGDVDDYSLRIRHFARGF